MDADCLGCYLTVSNSSRWTQSVSSHAEYFERFGVNGETTFAIMSLIIRVTILLIILIDSFCSSTAPSDKLSKVTWLDIRRCRCTRDDVFRGKRNCPSPLVPTDKKGKQDLYKCLCRAGTEKNRPELQRFCRVQTATLL